jgi:4-hydroxy-tetrahydrodipicolinate synthase
LDETAGRIPVVAGVTSADSDLTLRLATHAAASGARALMVAAPPQWKEAPQQIAYFQALSQAVPGLPLMLQNVPPPVGAGLDPEVLIKVVSAVPAISYIKEEALPSGQRLTKVLVNAPASLKGVLGGAGGRYITDELRRGACGTMPAIELAEVHVALYAAHRKGDSLAVRKLFTRMLPILNIQAVFRWALTKHVLLQRGLINHAVQRVDGPRLDDFDRADINDFMNDLSDLLMPAAVLAELRNPG